MSTPLDSYDLPEIDEELDTSTSHSNRRDKEPINPLKETETNIQFDKTESLNSLQHQITHHKSATHDINNPHLSPNAVFPEEYQIETDTGLVRSTTAMSLDRSKTPEQAKDDYHYVADDDPYEHVNTKGLTAEKLDKAVEKNRKALDHNSHSHGTWGKIKGLFGL